MHQARISLLLTVVLGAACSAPPVVHTDSDLDQCPPPGIKLKECVHPGAYLTGNLSDMTAVLNDLCQSPCTALESLGIQNSTLTSLSELKSLSHYTNIIGNLEIVNNNSLTDIHGLESVSHIGAVSIVDNPKLTTLTGLDEAEVATDIRVEGNPSLTALNAFRRTRTANEVTLWHNPNLADISSLSSLIEIHGLIIDGSALSDLHGLEQLQRVREEGWLAVWASRNLTTLAALSNLRFSGTEFVSFAENPLLPECEALALVGQTTFSEPPEIHDNDTTATCEQPQ